MIEMLLFSIIPRAMRVETNSGQEKVEHLKMLNHFKTRCENATAPLNKPPSRRSHTNPRLGSKSGWARGPNSDFRDDHDRDNHRNESDSDDHQPRCPDTVLVWQDGLYQSKFYGRAWITDLSRLRLEAS
jgi:hypothetical protein